MLRGHFLIHKRHFFCWIVLQQVLSELLSRSDNSGLMLSFLLITVKFALVDFKHSGLNSSCFNTHIQYVIIHGYTGSLYAELSQCDLCLPPGSSHNNLLHVQQKEDRSYNHRKRKNLAISSIYGSVLLPCHKK